jgi:hypothetical protein
MANDPLKARALILLSKGHESAHEGKPFTLDGDVARAARWRLIRPSMQRPWTTW